ncbi:MAG TPA: cupin domain-containing protein [Gemmatimonadaceae bacterium]|jgi:quercetin dioxygenase-like cupin family protein
MSMQIADVVIPAGAEGEVVMMLGTLVQVKVPSTRTEGVFSVVEHTVPPLAGPPLHTHPETEILYVLSGEFDVGIGAEIARAKEGAVIHVPPETPHSTKNVGERAGRLLSIYLPGSADRFFVEAGTPVSTGAPLPDLDRAADLSGVDVPAVLAIAERHGMRIVGTGR